MKKSCHDCDICKNVKEKNKKIDNLIDDNLDNFQKIVDEKDKVWMEIKKLFAIKKKYCFHINQTDNLWKTIG